MAAHLPLWLVLGVVALGLLRLLERELDATTRRKKKLAHRKYLRSDEWKARRAPALAKAEGRCRDCGRAAPLEVHHLTYRHWGREHAKDLRALCRDCRRRRHRQRRSPLENLLDRIFN